MRPIPTDLSKLDEVIGREYEDKIRGLAKDSIQNSWAARKSKKGRGFQTLFRLYERLGEEDDVLIIEDDGTKGMDDKRWKAFHSHWASTEKGYALGRVSRWGQGKTLFLYFSATNRILTESIDGDGTYRYSVRTNVGYLQFVKKPDGTVLADTPEPKDRDWLKTANGRLKLITDFFPSITPLDHQGTRIWILNVKPDLASEIREGHLVKHISESWWEIIQKYGACLEYEEVGLA